MRALSPGKTTPAISRRGRGRQPRPSGRTMAVVQVDHVSFSYEDQEALLVGVSLTLEPGWTGVVGPNGRGKTTLLRVLARELTPTSGRVRWTPPEARVATCPQVVVETAEDFTAFPAATDR